MKTTVSGQKTQKRYEVDVLYTIGIILVLIGHSHSSNWDQFSGTILEFVIRFIYTFHMPLFFFIAGFLFQNSTRLEKEGYWKWLKNKALRLLIPYLFWSLLAAIPKYYIEHGGITGVGKSILDVVINPRSGVWGHFWFLPVLFMVYLLFGLAKVVIKQKMVFLYGSIVATLILFFLPIRTNAFGLADLRTEMVFFAFGLTWYAHYKKLIE